MIVGRVYSSQIRSLAPVQAAPIAPNELCSTIAHDGVRHTDMRQKAAKLDSTLQILNAHHQGSYQEGHGAA